MCDDLQATCVLCQALTSYCCVPTPPSAYHDPLGGPIVAEADPQHPRSL